MMYTSKTSDLAIQRHFLQLVDPHVPAEQHVKISEPDELGLVFPHCLDAANVVWESRNEYWFLQMRRGHPSLGLRADEVILDHGADDEAFERAKKTPQGDRDARQQSREEANIFCCQWN